MKTVDILIKALQEIVDKSEGWQEEGRDARNMPWWDLGDKAQAALIRFHELEKMTKNGPQSTSTKGEE